LRTSGFIRRPTPAVSSALQRAVQRYRKRPVSQRLLVGSGRFVTTRSEVQCLVNVRQIVVRSVTVVQYTCVCKCSGLSCQYHCTRSFTFAMLAIDTRTNKPPPTVGAPTLCTSSTVRGPAHYIRVIT